MAPRCLAKTKVNKSPLTHGSVLGLEDGALQIHELGRLVAPGYIFKKQFG